MLGSLYRKRILVTREKSQAKVFSTIISQYDGIPVEVPLLDIVCKHPIESNMTIENLSKYEWIFFTSSNGVDCFFNLVDESNRSDLASSKFAAVGHKTELALNKYGFIADFVPTLYNAITMASEFSNVHENSGPLLLVRGNLSRTVLPDQLAQKGFDIDLLEVYETVYNYNAKKELNQQLVEAHLDFITFTSPSTIDAFIEMVDNKNNLDSYICVCIGTTTEKRAQEVGFDHIPVPETFTIEAMVKSMIDYLMKKG